MSIRSAYAESLQHEGHASDPAQLNIIAHLEALQTRIMQNLAGPPGLRGWVSRFTSRRERVPGLYIWGGVGRGKTFLMDLFFDSLQIRKKKRIHFHRMMHDVHARLAALGDIEDPLDRVASDIASEVSVLCFDEFFVSDIGDAMILGRLLEGLFSRGVTLVATSNSRPDQLYREGLQRQRFLPAIDLLNTHTEVVHMDDGPDYRLRLLQEAGTWLTPHDGDAVRRMQHFFEEAASHHPQADRQLDINGRTISVQQCAESIAWFDFEAICDGPRSQNDYIEIARLYPSVIVSDVPQLDKMREDQARRFIALVDEFYDRRVNLVISADTDARSLYVGERLKFEFERTLSRLTEMQSMEYLALPHLA